MTWTAKDQAALTAFKRLPGRDRRHVLRLARHGRPIPDPNLREVAVRWAEMVQRQRTPTAERLTQWPFAIAFDLIIPGGGLTPGGAHDNVGARWIARKILDANPDPADPATPAG